MKSLLQNQNKGKPRSSHRNLHGEALRTNYYQRCNKMLHVMARGLSKSEQDADDLVQEVFLAICRKNDLELQGIDSPEAFTVKILKDKFADYIKKKHRVSSVDPFDAALDRIDMNSDEDAPEPPAPNLLGKLMPFLTENQYSVVELYLQHQTHKEIAAELRISESNSKTILNRAKTRMKYLVQKSKIEF